MWWQRQLVWSRGRWDGVWTITGPSSRQLDGELGVWYCSNNVTKDATMVWRVSNQLTRRFADKLRHAPPVRRGGGGMSRFLDEIEMVPDVACRTCSLLNSGHVLKESIHNQW